MANGARSFGGSFHDGRQMARGSQFCLAAHLGDGHPGALGSRPIPLWPGSFGWSHRPRADAGPEPGVHYHHSAGGGGREEGSWVPAKIQRGCLASCPGGLWTLDAQFPEVAAARTHGHAGRAADPSTSRDPGADLPTAGAGSPRGRDIVIKRWKREMDLLGGSICRAVAVPFVFQW